MFLTFTIWSLLFPFFVTSDRYHPSDHQIPQSRLQHPEEISASYWKLLAQSRILSKLSINKDDNENDQKPVKNIIFFIGDGMDVTTISASRMLLGGEEKHLSFEKFPHLGYAKTYCVDKKVPDSACTATAYLCGIKNNLGTIGLNAKVTRKDCEGMNQRQNHVLSIANWAQKAKKGTGIVTTTRITHASPAGAYAHVADRDWEADSDIPENCDTEEFGDVAKQLVHGETGKNFDVIFGGGRKNFLPSNEKDDEGKFGVRKDGRNLINEWKKLQVGFTWEYVWNKSALQRIPHETQKVLGLFESSHCHYQLDIEKENLIEEPSLTDMTLKAIELLSKSTNGFFLFVEGGRIDHGHHDTRPQYALRETIEFQRAIERAKGVIDEKETLIVVSADHGHTITYSGYGIRSDEIFSFAGNGSDNLPYSTLSYANGPGYENTFAEQKGDRIDLRTLDYTNPKFKFQSTVPLDSATHGGADVGVWATGPYSHLFEGVYEQNALPFLMAYAGKFGPYLEEELVKDSSGQIGISGIFSWIGLIFYGIKFW